MLRLMVCWVAFFATCSVANGGAGDVTLRTSHPQYPGEGAFQTVDDCVAFATRGKTSSQEKAISLYLWMLTHQWHLMSPMEWFVPGRVPDTKDPGNYETVLFDANRARFSYGYGLCGTVHAWNEPYWNALEMAPRRREFPNHINSEIFYDGHWHAFDTDMAGLLFRPDGVVAGYDDIQREPKLAESVKAPLPHYPFAWPSDFNSMKAGWQEVASRKSWYRLYNGGYAAHPGIVHLRGGEQFTRWYDRDHYGGPDKRRFWQNQKGGPSRNWTYFNNGVPSHDHAEANARSEATYCNGEFIYKPKLHNPQCQEGMTEFTANVGHQSASPHLYSTDGRISSVTFRHFSPYVICGDPVDNANPMSGRATDGLVVEGRRVGSVSCSVSADEGQTWTEVPLQDIPESKAQQTDGAFRVDLTESVKGRYGWQIRLSWQGKAGLDTLKFTTTTQVCQAIYPRLSPNGCEVEYRSTPRAVVAVLPNFGMPESEVSAFEQTSLRSENLEYHPRSIKNRYGYQARDKAPASVVFKLNAPQQLTEVRAAIRYQLPVPPTPGCDFRLEISTDAGRTWREFARANIPADNEFSSGWLAGAADVSAENCRNTLVRVHLHTPGRRAALIDAQLYGIHKVPSPGPVTIEMGWLEDGNLRTHSAELARKTISTRLQIPTGNSVHDQFVRIEARN